ncbi:DUF1036 domain-containing protein [Devosia rhodophyticola]|uniref:DUF1036 domain-containing protein n=1 Tax=Devosia rhodophyticola TaxID=3026423 RepID=A0ABY7YUF1_9HYPH|nr:DUF1036 domain-containing protein [Devosia rhodophyticola]WDR04879.1 DUF1036 domain-containing protein [Devosia rhodophyticola]
MAQTKADFSMTSGSPLHFFRHGVTLVGAFLSGMFFFSAPAMADLRVCNETGNMVSVAMGYRAERGWQSEGWWQTQPGDCQVLYQGSLADRSYYYIYAVDDIGGGEWDGSVFMCTRDETFTIFGVEDCLARGYERTGFFEIDTQKRTDWTLKLTDKTGEPGIVGPEDDAPLDNPDQPVDPAGQSTNATQDSESTDTQ